MYRFVSVFFVGIHVQVCVRVLCRYPCTGLCPCSLSVSMYRFVSVFFVGIHVQVCVRVLCRYPCTGLFLCSL